jgi:hypothetical protein
MVLFSVDRVYFHDRLENRYEIRINVEDPFFLLLRQITAVAVVPSNSVANQIANAKSSHGLFGSCVVATSGGSQAVGKSHRTKTTQVPGSWASFGHAVLCQVLDKTGSTFCSILEGRPMRGSNIIETTRRAFTAHALGQAFVRIASFFGLCRTCRTFLFFTSRLSIVLTENYRYLVLPRKLLHNIKKKLKEEVDVY